MERKIDVLNFYNCIVELINKNERNPKNFSYGLYRNENILSSIVESFSKMKGKISESSQPIFTELQEKRKELIEKFSEPNEVNLEGKYVQKNIKQFKQEYDLLIESNEKYKKLMEEEKQIKSDFENFMNSKFDEKVDLIKINVNDLPENIEPQTIYQLRYMIME
jgi:predicted nuclease with TOPRIM domain